MNTQLLNYFETGTTSNQNQLTDEQKKRLKGIEYLITNELLERYKDKISYSDLQLYFSYHTNNNEHIECPLCNSELKRYKRKINSDRVDFLLSLAHLLKVTHQEYINYKDVLKYQVEKYKSYSTDYGLLQKFGLIDIQRGLGLVTLTRLGINFILGKIEIPSYLILLNNQIIEKSPETTHVFEIKRDLKTIINDNRKERKPY